MYKTIFNMLGDAILIVITVGFTVEFVRQIVKYAVDVRKGNVKE
jgi:hypothetical protein